MMSTETTVTVTSENLAQFAADKLGLQTQEPPKEEAEVKEEKPKKNPKLESRFSELTHARRAAEERAEKEAQRAAKLEAELNEVRNGGKKQKTDEPQETDYTNPMDYARDWARWEAKRQLTEEKQARENKERQEQFEKVTKAWQERANKLRAVTPDFDDVLQSSTAAVSDEARDALIESEYGPQIVYELAGDDDLSEKVSKMNVKDQLKWIGRMEAKLEAKGEEAKDEKGEKKEEKPSAKQVVQEEDEPKPVKRPPAPISPVKGGKSPDIVKATETFTGSYQDYKRQRAAGMIK